LSYKCIVDKKKLPIERTVNGSCKQPSERVDSGIV